MKKSKSERVLITGGGGFMGSHLAEKLVEQGYKVTILNTLSEKALKNLKDVRTKIKIVWGSVTDEEIVDKTVRGNDVVIHLAARINVDESLKDPGSAIKTNIFGTYNVLEAVKKHGSFLILGSSCEVYGEPIEISRKLNEHAELRPKSPYSASKAGADRIAFAYHHSYGIPLVIVRPFNVFGERQKEDGFGALIPLIVKRALDKKPLYLFGSGQQKRDYMNIDDLIDAYLLVFKKRKKLNGMVINFASGKSTTVGSIVKYIAKKMNAKIEKAPSRPGEVKDFPADITLAKKFGFRPKMNIWKGIDRYIDWRLKLEK